MRGPLACGRMKEELGYAPAHTLESGVAAFADWMRAHPESFA
jgi:nucleoside-diphosphate-sugar epimerase